jgi:nucleotide-binding universal stress UspA family protein
VSCRLGFGDVKKIMIPTDGSDYSMRAAEYGISIGKMLGAEITVVYVIDTVVSSQIAKVGEKEDVELQLRRDGERYLNYVRGLSEGAGLKTSTLLLKGRPFEQIVHLARSMDMDLIVMGTYGRRGADRILIGSVAERVIEYAHCPVLVVR